MQRQITTSISVPLPAPRLKQVCGVGLIFWRLMPYFLMSCYLCCMCPVPVSHQELLKVTGASGSEEIICDSQVQRFLGQKPDL